MTIKFHRIYIVGLFLLILLIRLINIDADPPNYNYSGVNVTDEPYYCIYGVNDHLAENGRLISELQDPSAYFLFQHNYLLTKLSLDIFGTTYVGLRVPVALLGFLTVLMLFFIVKWNFSLTHNEELMFLIAVGLEYSLLVYSRFQTPQIYSLFWITLVLFVMSNKWDMLIRVTLTSMLITIAVFWVYPYVVFIALGFFFWVLYEAAIAKSLKIIWFAALGVLGAFTFFWGAFLILGQSPLDYFEMMSSIREVRDETASAGLSVKSLVRDILQIPFTNLLRFQPALLIITLGGLPLMFARMSKIQAFERLIFLCILMAFAQSLVVHSYPFKKWIVVLPLFVLASVSVIKMLPTTTRSERFIASGAAVFAALISLYGISVNNASDYWQTFSSDYKIVLLSTWEQSILISSALLTLVIFLVSLWGKQLQLTITFALILFTSLGFSIPYLANPQFNYKSELLKWSSIIKSNQLIIGDFSHAFSFYNTGVVAHNPYSIKFGQIKQDKVDSVLHSFNSAVIVKKDLNLRLDSSSINYSNTTFDFYSGERLKLYIWDCDY